MDELYGAQPRSVRKVVQSAPNGLGGPRTSAARPIPFA